MPDLKRYTTIHTIPKDSFCNTLQNGLYINLSFEGGLKFHRTFFMHRGQARFLSSCPFKQLLQKVCLQGKTTGFLFIHCVWQITHSSPLGLSKTGSRDEEVQIMVLNLNISTSNPNSFVAYSLLHSFRNLWMTKIVPAFVKSTSRSSIRCNYKSTDSQQQFQASVLDYLI